MLASVRSRDGTGPASSPTAESPEAWVHGWLGGNIGKSLSKWDDFQHVAVVRLDSKGRLLVPKRLREKVGLREGGLARVEVRGGALVVEPLQSVADAYYGVFKVESWPEDLDSFLVEAVKELWLRKATST